MVIRKYIVNLVEEPSVSRCSQVFDYCFGVFEIIIFGINEEGNDARV